jgi:hypothetical protein
MKAKLPLLVVLGMTLVSLNSLHGQSFLTNGLVAYYPFNGNANDESGNNNNGTPINLQFGTNRFGQPLSSSVYVSGTDVELQTLSLSVTSYTLSVWVLGKHSDNSGIGYTIVGGWNATNSNGDGYYANGLYFDPLTGLKGAADTWDWVSQNGARNGAWWWAQTGTPQSDLDSTWKHVVVSFTFPPAGGGTIRLFVNGVFKESYASPRGPVSLGHMSIGSYRTPWVDQERTFVGSIDDVRIYNRALSDSEIANLYNYEASTPCVVPRRATATAQVVNGFVVGATITDAGCGYTNSPVVLIVGGGGSGATAQAAVSNGRVTGIAILTTGSGYTSVPEIRIASPPFIPKLYVETSRVRVNMDLVLGRRYQLQSSADLTTWTNVGTTFVADTERLSQYYDVDNTGHYFRIQEVP